MLVSVEIKGINNITSNLREILDSPLSFLDLLMPNEVFGFDYFSYDNEKDLETVIELIGREIKYDEFDTVCRFLREMEYKAINEVLKEHVFVDYIINNFEKIGEYFGFDKNAKVFFYDGKNCIDVYLQNYYEVRNNKIVKKGNADDLLIKADLMWFDKILFVNVNPVKFLKELAKEKHVKRNMISIMELQEYMQKEISDQMYEVKYSVWEMMDELTPSIIWDDLKALASDQEEYRKFLNKQ